MPADRSAWDVQDPEEGPVAVASRPPHEQSLETPQIIVAKFEGAQFPCRFADFVQNARKDVQVRFVIDGRYAHMALPLIGHQQMAMHVDVQPWSLAYANRD